MITANTYFSGAGGMDLGLIKAGVKVQQSYEMDKTCCETLRMNFDHDVVCDDIRNRTVLSQPDADVMIGTYPCKEYSSIADIHGSRTGDELFLHFFRIIAIRKPKGYVVENVPGMKKFPVVMEAMTKLPDYYVNVVCPVDANCWLPQNRKRLIIIGTRKPFLLMNPVKRTGIRLSDILEKNPIIAIPDSVYSRLKGKYRDLPIISDPTKDNAPCAVAHYSKDKSTRLVKDENFPMGVRPYTTLEYARLQGFPDTFKFAGFESEVYRQIGNAVAVDMGEWIGQNLIKYFTIAA